MNGKKKQELFVKRELAFPYKMVSVENHRTSPSRATHEGSLCLLSISRLKRFQNCPQWYFLTTVFLNTTDKLVYILIF